MSWETQGRQEHGWFGSGTSSGGQTPLKGGSDPLFAAGNVAARIDAIAHSAVAHMPRPDRNQAAAAFDQQRSERLRQAMTAWIGANLLTNNGFQDHLVDPTTSDAAISQLRAAAEGAKTATTHEELREASADLAGAMRSIGLERWPGFLRDAADRAEANGRVVVAQAAPATQQGPHTATDAMPTDHPPPAVPGAYVADNPLQWAGHASVGNGECVALVRAATGAPQSRLWQRGALVQGNTAIQKGAAIATFDRNGHYEGHTALYVGQDEHGIQVIDQWNRRDQQGNIKEPHPPSERTLPLNDPRHARIDRGEFYYVVR